MAISTTGSVIFGDFSWSHLGQFGSSLAGGHDVNGDGFADLLIGAEFDLRLLDENGVFTGWGYDAGTIFVVYGAADGWAPGVDLADSTAWSGYRIEGQAGDYLGANRNSSEPVSLADIDGDGQYEVLFGTPQGDGFDGTSGAGRAYILQNSAALTGTTLNLADFEQKNGYLFSGTNDFERVGSTLVSIGDPDGDGAENLALQLRGNIGNEYSGEPSTAGLVLSFDDLPVSTDIALGTAFQDIPAVLGDRSIYLGENRLGYAGDSISAIGDFNGDGLDDFAISAPVTHVVTPAGTLNWTGAAYVVLGGTDAATQDIVDLSASSVDGLIQISGEAFIDRFGDPLTGIGDINGDGFDDLLAISKNSDDPNFKNGAAYVVYGSQTPAPEIQLSELSPTSGSTTIYTRIGGFNNSNAFNAGRDITGVGDVNGDGYSDFLIASSAVRASEAGGAIQALGAAWLIFGDQNGLGDALDVGTLDGTNGYRISTSAVTNKSFAFGSSVAALGDINNDGFDDFAIGARQDREYGGQGAVYIFHGGEALEVVDAADGTTDGYIGVENLGGDIPGNNSNAAPVATLDDYRAVVVRPGDVAILDVLANDTDPDGDTLEITSVTPSANGLVSITPSQTIRFEAGIGFGPGDFTYTITDPGGLTSTASVWIDVINAAPIAVDDDVTVAPGQWTTLDLISNDSDPDGDSFAIDGISFDGFDDGIQYRFSDDQLEVLTAASYGGGGTISYDLVDQFGAYSNVADVRVFVNFNPTAVDDYWSTQRGQTIQLDPRDNDVDPEGDFITITDFERSQDGVGTMSRVYGNLSFDPDPDFRGTAQFWYEINGGGRASIFITIEDQPPVAVDDTYATRVGQTLVFNPLDNDTDPEGDPIRLEWITTNDPGAGTVSRIDGSFTPALFTPEPGFIGEASFTYKLRNSSDLGKVTIDVQDIRPELSPDFVDVRPGGSFRFVDTIVRNDSFDQPASIQTSSSSSLGQISVDPEGYAIYTAPTGFNGTDTFLYRMNYSGGFPSPWETVHVTVNNPVEARDDSYVMGATQPFASIDILANDFDPDGNEKLLDFASTTQPQNGSVSFAGGFAIYTPDPGFIGYDSFTYGVFDRVGDSFGEMQFATVDVLVNAKPVGTDDLYVMAPNTFEVLDVVANDVSPTGQPLATWGVTGGLPEFSNGVGYNSPNYYGVDKFSYILRDVHFEPAVDPVDVYIVVDEPVQAQDDIIIVPDTSGTRTYNLLDNDTIAGLSDVRGGLVTQTSGLAVATTLAVDGTFSFARTGPWTRLNTFDYQAVEHYEWGDGFTHRISDTAQVAVAYSSMDSAAPIVPNLFRNMEPDTVARFNPLTAVSDPDGDDVFLSWLGDPSVGTVTDNGNGTFDYLPPTGFHGIATMEVLVVDDTGTFGKGTRSFIVNTLPDVQDETLRVAPGATVSLNVLANDTDADGDLLTLHNVRYADGQTFTGLFSFDSDTGEITVEPLQPYSRDVELIYTVSDGFNGVDGRLKIVYNSLPIARDDFSYVEPGETTVIFAGINDSDPDGDALSFFLPAASSPSYAQHGTLIVDGTTIRYTPDAGYTGYDTFDYFASDGTNSARGTVEVVVDAAPELGRDFVRVGSGGSETVSLLANDTNAEGANLSFARMLESSTLGTVNVTAAGVLTFDAAAGATGTEVLDYLVYETIVTGGRTFQREAVGKVEISVAEAPRALIDFVRVAPGETVFNYDLLANDIDPGGLDLDVIGFGPLSNSVATVSPITGTRLIDLGGSSITVPYYTGAVNVQGNARGEVETSYTVANGFAEDTATVRIVVDTPPVAVDDILYVQAGAGPATYSLNVLTNDTDGDNDALSLRASGPSWAKFDSDGTFTYQPNGNAIDQTQFEYEVRSTTQTSFGPVYTTDQGLVRIELNEAPDAVDDTRDIRPGEFLAFDVTANDTDADGDGFRVVRSDAFANGTGRIFDGGGLIYTPNAGFVGSETVTYDIIDGKGGSDTGTVTINVVNSAPVAQNDSLTTGVDTDLAIAWADIFGNDSDADGDLLTLRSVAQPNQGGTIAQTATGLTFSPDAGFSGQSRFTYDVVDPYGAQSFAATVTVTVAAPTLVAVRGTSSNDAFLATTVAERFENDEGSDVFSGILDAFNGDSIAQFDGNDSIVVTGSSFGATALSVFAGSAIMRIDGDGDGSIDAELRLEGDYAGAQFFVEALDEGTGLFLYEAGEASVLRVDGSVAALQASDGRDVVELGSAADDGQTTYTRVLDFDPAQDLVALLEGTVLEKAIDGASGAELTLAGDQDVVILSDVLLSDLRIVEKDRGLIDETPAFSAGDAFTSDFGGSDRLDIRLTSLGVGEAETGENFTIWRLRNATDNAELVQLKGYGTDFDQSYLLPAHSQTIVLSDATSGAGTHVLQQDGDTVQTKAASKAPFELDTLLSSAYVRLSSPDDAAPDDDALSGPELIALVNAALDNRYGLPSEKDVTFVSMTESSISLIGPNTAEQSTYAGAEVQAAFDAYAAALSDLPNHLNINRHSSVVHFDTDNDWQMFFGNGTRGIEVDSDGQSLNDLTGKGIRAGGKRPDVDEFVEHVLANHGTGLGDLELVAGGSRGDDFITLSIKNNWNPDHFDHLIVQGQIVADLIDTHFASIALSHTEIHQDGTTSSGSDLMRGLPSEMEDQFDFVPASSGPPLINDETSLIDSPDGFLDSGELETASFKSIGDSNEAVLVSESGLMIMNMLTHQDDMLVL